MSVTTAVFDLRVARVRRLSPTFLRLTLTGDGLVRFHPCGPLGPRDLRVKLVFPEPGGAVTVRPTIERGWFARWRRLDPAQRGYLRTYSIREARLDGPEPELDIDVVLHEGDGVPAGPGSAWARSAQPGQPVLLLGPRASEDGSADDTASADAVSEESHPGDGTSGDDTPEGIEWRPPRAGAEGPVQVLLAGDETAVPAVASILATLPAGYLGEAVLEVPDAADVCELPTRSGVRVKWLIRDGRPHGEELTEAVRELADGFAAGREPGGAPAQLPVVDIDRERLWDVGVPGAEADPLPDGTAREPTEAGAGSGAKARPDAHASVGGPAPLRYAWIAGEAAVVRDLRSHLVHDCRIERRQVAFMGYWRRGMAEPN